MSHTMTFDTLAFVKKLEASGIEARQSEAITEAVSGVFENNLVSVCTKDELNAVEARLEAKIDVKVDRLTLEMDKRFAEFDGKLSKLESKIIMWAVGLVFTQTAVLSMIKFMH